MKKSKLLVRAFTVAIAVAVVSVSAISSSLAATDSTGGNGTRIAPVRTDLTIQPGSSKTISVYVTNVSGGTTTYKVVANDFIANNDESGAPALMLDGEPNDKHGLKKFMTTQDTVTVKPGVQAEVKVTVAIPKDVAGGGYYGAIRFVPTTANNGGNLSLSGNVASLILVRVPGDVVEKVSLISFDARNGNEPKTIFTSNKKIKAVVRFRNEGNIQEQPFGKIILKKGAKTIASYEVNGGDQPGNVLPDSVRKFSVDLKNLSSYGKYTIVGNFGYGIDGQLLSAKTTFYIIPIWLILIGLLIIALILFLIFGLPKLVKNYNKRVIRKAGRR